MADFVGPPASYPEFDGWDEKKHKSAERAIELLDGVKSYKNAGAIGAGAKYKPHYVDLVRRGGLSQDEASQIARYKMWRSGKKTPEARVPEDTTEQIVARSSALSNATPEQRTAMFNDAKAHSDDSYTRFYDDLIGPPKEEPKPEAKLETKKKQGGA